MKILELYLKAFGPFTDRRIVLEEADPPGAAPGGLTVLVGRNEAGKSSALRAIRGLFYGIEVRSSDDFVHRHPEMRVGARLRFRDGEELGVMRRKANKNPLFDFEDAEAIEGTRLKALTEAISEVQFDHFYGLTHRGLVDGADGLLADEGELGRALLGARLGVPNLRRVIEGLESEAAELFSARGTKPRINAGLKAWNASQKEIKELALDPKDWEAKSEDVREAEVRLDAVSGEIEKAHAELSRLRRLKQALPALVKQARAREELEALPTVPPLSDDFETRLERARAACDAARERKRSALAKIERETERQQALVPAPRVLGERDGIETLFQGISGYRATRDDLPGHEASLAAIDREIEDRAASFGGLGDPDRVRALRDALGRAGRIKTLAAEYAKFEDGREKASKERAEAQAELDRLEKQLEASGTEVDAAPLRGALDRVVKLGAIDESIAEQREQIENLRDDGTRQQRALELDAIDAERLSEIPFPTEDVIARYAERFDEEARRGNRAREQLQTLREEQRRVAEELDRLRGEGAVPRESDLEAARLARDDDWRKIRRGIVDADPPPEVAARAELADRFERSQSRADQTADRLRVDAERVARQSALDAKARRVEAEAADAEREVERCLDVHRTLSDEWSRIWVPTGIAARPAQTLRSWRRGLDSVLEKRAQLREAQRRLERDEAARDDATRTLAQACDALGAEGASAADLFGAGFGAALGVESGERLDRSIEYAKAALDRLTARERLFRGFEVEREQAAARLARADRALDRAVEALATWSAEWSRELAVLEFDGRTRTVDSDASVSAAAGLADAAGAGARARAGGASDIARGSPARVHPSEAIERLEAIQLLLQRLAAREELSDRVTSMRKRLTEFETVVRERMLRAGLGGEKGEAGGELEGLAIADTSEFFDAEESAHRLYRNLGEAVQSETLAQKCAEAISEAREEFEEAAANQASGVAALEGLALEAGVEEEGQIDEALRIWKQVDAALRDRDEATAQLEHLAEGRSIEELAEQSRAIDPDRVAARIESLEVENRARLEEQRDAISELRSLRDALEAMDGSSAVAELAERGQAELASVRRDLERYVELRLAKRILEREIAQYREENQAPLLKKAGAMFAGLTQGRYPAIQSDHEGESGARLVALNAKQKVVPVRALSSGTRDQLFLALRLATLEESLERTEPMPLIADDILVEFDDERTAATLEVLARLAEKTQILLFSHHAYVADSARKLGSSARVVEL